MKYLYTVILLVCFTLSAFAHQDSTANKKVDYRFALGVQIGTDIGGALPFPFKHIPSTFNPYPKLTPSLGAKFTFPVIPKWTLGVEATYKRIAMNADARVKDQRFESRTADNIIAYFTGSARMNMEFTMLEVPVYGKYTFRNGKDRILFGPYFAWVINSDFIVRPVKGFIGNEPGKVETSQDVDKLPMNFSSSTDMWDIGVVGGYEREIFPRVEIGLRFMVGFKDIFKPDNQYFDYKMINMRGTIVVSYNLFSIKPAKLNPLKRAE